MKLGLVFLALVMAFATAILVMTTEVEKGRAEGSVSSVERSNGTITVRHGPIQGMNMPAMTMEFRVSEPTMLERLKQGDRIVFELAKRDGNLIITSIRSSK